MRVEFCHLPFGNIYKSQVLAFQFLLIIFSGIAYIFRNCVYFKELRIFSGIAGTWLTVYRENRENMEQMKIIILKNMFFNLGWA